MTRGGKNLLILGGISVLITIITSGVALALYYYSGDVYFDRSRPGYLPNTTEEDEEEKLDDYSFSDTGSLSESDLDVYLEHLDSIIDSMNHIEDPFSKKSLSNDSLGLPEK